MSRVVATVALAVIFTGAALAQGVPSIMSYQGMLTELSTGQPVADGDYQLTFTIYDGEVAGSQVWTETQSFVRVSKGLFMVMLGSNTPLTIPFDRQYWLGIRVGSEPEFAPRTRLSTAAYAFRARSADDVKNGIIRDEDVAADANIASSKLAQDVVTENDIVGGTAISVNKSGGICTISVALTALILEGDVTGPIGANKIAANAVGTAEIEDNSITAADLAVPVVSSINNVTNDGGNIDLVAGTGITITPDDLNNRITISGSTGGSLTLPYAGTASSTSTAFKVTQSASGAGIEVDMDGTGNAAYFHIDNTTSTNNTLRAVTSSTNLNSDALEVEAVNGNGLDAHSSSSTEATIWAYNTNSSAGAKILNLAAGNTPTSPVFYVERDGDAYLLSDLTTGTVESRTTNGASSTPARGVTYKDNVAIAWGSVAASGSLNSGFGCTVSNPSTGVYTVSLKNTMGSTAAPVVTVGPASGIRIWYISSQSTSGFTVRIYSLSISPTPSLTLTDEDFNFVVFGN